MTRTSMRSKARLKNDSPCLQLCKRRSVFAQPHIFFLVQYESTDRQHVHPRSQDAVDCLGRRLDDGLILIERCVQQHRHACYFLELVNQLPISRIHFALHSLEPPGPVAVRHRRDPLALPWLDLVCHHHEWRGIVHLEIIAHLLRKNRRTERPERLTILDTAVENLFHILAARVRKDASVPQSARPKLHTTLKPTDDLPLGNRLHCAANQVLLCKLVVLASGSLQIVLDLTV